jgi:hypothetical protein
VTPCIRLVSMIVLLAASGCAWDRFDALRDNTPVLGLEAPPEIPDDFAATLAGLSAGNRTSVLIGGAPKGSGAAVYLLGQDEEAVASAEDTDYCPTSNASRMCVLAAQAASLQSALAPNGRTRANCYVTGVGSAVSDVGLWTRCEDTAEFAIPVPADILADVVEPAIAGSLTYDVTLASETTTESVLLAGVGELSRAFYYEPASIVPLDLVPTDGSAPDGFGSTVAVLGVGSSRILVVGAPDSSVLHYFRTDGTGAIHLGCSSGDSGLGRALGTGDFDGDGDWDVAVSDESGARVLSGRLLGELSEAASGSCVVDLGPLTLATLGCANFGDARDCSGSRFGSALGIADFDGDGEAEVAVGAPRMTVRGTEDAGAVLIFDRAGDIVDVRTVSTASAGDLFGARLVTVSQADRDILVVAAPGARTASVVYCATIAGTGESPRCP